MGLNSLGHQIDVEEFRQLIFVVIQFYNSLTGDKVNKNGHKG
jgi:hypothetical protein